MPAADAAEPVDQTDVLLHMEQLTARVAELETANAAGVARIAELTGFLDKANAALGTANETMTAATAEIDRLKAEKTTFDAAVVKAVATKGIAAAAVKLPADNSKPPTLTEQCRAARASR